MSTSTPPGRRRKARRRGGRGRKVLLAIGIVVLCIGLGAVGAAVYTSIQKPLYGATAVIRVFDPAVAAQNGSNVRIDPTRQTAIEVTAAQSDSITHDANATLRSQKVNYDHVTWTDLVDQDAISVTCYAGKASNTVACASQFAAVFISHRKLAVPQTFGPSRDALVGQSKQQKANIDALQAEISKTNAVSQASKLKGLLAQVSALNLNVNNLSQQIAAVDAQIAGTEATYSVIQPASLPDSKVSPTPLRNYLIGLIGGLLVGVAILLMWQQVAATRRMAGVAEAPAYDDAPEVRAPRGESLNGHHPSKRIADPDVDESATTES